MIRLGSPEFPEGQPERQDTHSRDAAPPASGQPGVWRSAAAAARTRSAAAPRRPPRPDPASAGVASSARDRRLRDDARRRDATPADAAILCAPPRPTLSRSGRPPVEAPPARVFCRRGGGHLAPAEGGGGTPRRWASPRPCGQGAAVLTTTGGVTARSGGGPRAQMRPGWRMRPRPPRPG
ncbi:translation initiation factor IF-2-like [Schistocerca serialis cubense]|uniref:translation initiation factor IF-2-like n=1 Tax=Schistocerca serialis cubense TaxID=2023355 RepID=UPI00214EC9E1|nr:translation initiation factor IF-2-like [Schistocerca serialis cubense]